MKANKKTNLKAVSQNSKKKSADKAKTKPAKPVKPGAKKPMAKKTIKPVPKNSAPKKTTPKKERKFYTVNINVQKKDTIQTYTEVENGNLRPFARVNEVKKYKTKIAAKKQADIIKAALPSRKGEKIMSFISEY